MRKFPSYGSMSKAYADKQSAWKGRAMVLTAIAAVVCLYFWFAGLGGGGPTSFSGVDRSESYKVKVIPNSLSDEELAALPKDTFSHLAMIDAGSSGCRAHIYRYGKLGSTTGALYVLPQHVSKKIKPGLSSFADSPEKAGESLAGLIEFIKSEVPSTDWELTPIWLKATAGLRMLPTAQSDAVLGSVRGFLANKANSPFLFRPSWASIISGNEEGGFGWIAYNYLKKIIGPMKLASNAMEPYAVVEMGGASAQVSQMAPTAADAANIPPEYRFTFNIEGEEYILYTHSYLGFGAEVARETFNAQLVANSTPAAAAAAAAVAVAGTAGAAIGSVGHVSDPCLNKGYVYGKDTARAEAYEGPSKVDVDGTADANSACSTAVKNIFKDKSASECGKKAKTPIFPITFGCAHQPAFVANSKNLLVFENFYYMSSAIGVKNKDGEKGTFPLITTPARFEEAANSYCSQPNAALQTSYPLDGSPKNNNVKMCFVSSYAYSFLTDGLGLSKTREITIQKEVSKDVEIEWALGAAYKEAADFLKRTNLRPV